MILVQNDIPCTKIEETILCEEGVEIQAVKLYLVDTISQLMSEAANRKVFIG